MTLRAVVREILPPVLLRLYRRCRDFARPPIIEWAHVPEGWDYAKTHREVKGWNVQGVLATYQNKWPRFVQLSQGTGPLGIAHESDLSSNDEIGAQNTVLCFAYSLALAADGKERVSMLDWGGGIGHYCLLARAALPMTTVDYYCKDMPLLAERGAELFPDAHFSVDDSCLERTYDFVLASGSMHYAEDWSGLLAKLAGATAGYCLITRLPTVVDVPSYVVVQRPYAIGYDTEYIGWCLNRAELLHEADRHGLRLVREFAIAESPPIKGAPEPCNYRAFLFTVLPESSHART